MSWRVIVRFSLNNDKQSTLRNKIVKLLEDNHINRTATGTWESAAIAKKNAAKCIARVLLHIAHCQKIGASPDAHLDHIWIYMDSTEPST